VLEPAGQLLALIKPQFEAGAQLASEHRGVIRDPELRRRIIGDVLTELEQGGFELIGSCDSRLPGPKGNLEHFVHARPVAAMPPPQAP
jgi:23S rRNA (cytidine1920-2'-O)/16S rRNA (cytidine1409-2'-O)-methyltransferase